MALRVGQGTDGLARLMHGTDPQAGQGIGGASPNRVTPAPATGCGTGQHVWPTLDMRAGCAGIAGR